MGDQLDKELARLQNEMIDLGVIVERSIIESVDVLKKRQIKEAKRLIDADSEINRRRYAIEWDCLVLIARQQPLATDLRTLAAILEIVTELERIGDYAKGIAKIYRSARRETSDKAACGHSTHGGIGRGYAP